MHFVHLSRLLVTYIRVSFQLCHYSFGCCQAQHSVLCNHLMRNPVFQLMMQRYQQCSKNLSEVKFTIGTSAKSIKLTPRSCLKFVMEGCDEYLSYTGERLVNPISDYDVLDKRYSSFDDELEKVVAFLRLVTRTLNSELYVLTDSKRTNFFYRLPAIRQCCKLHLFRRGTALFFMLKKRFVP